MKAIKLFIGIFMISLLATACSTTGIRLPEKYNLDNELTEAKEITGFRIDSWESIDFQSLIIRTIGKDYYLLVLQRPATQLPSSETIGTTLSMERLRTGFDHVIVADSTGSESYIIQKMYKFKDREEALKFKEILKKG